MHKSYSHTRIFHFLLLLCLLIPACGRKLTTAAAPPESPAPVAESAININTASVEEIGKIPYIGETFASRIVEHREKYGPFRRPEHLMLVDGISDKKFRLFRSFIRTE